MLQFIKEHLFTSEFYKKPAFWLLLAAIVLPFGFLAIPVIIGVARGSK